MAVFAMSDLHLALGVNKPMDVFGYKWDNYMERIKNSWENNVSHVDTVIVPGDVSWATYVDQAYRDFKFIDDLPGEKIILKGNHDYWWTTVNKLKKFIIDNDFQTIRFLHNDCYEVEGYLICGTRGWKCPGDEEFTDDDMKIYKRELQRLEKSLKNANELLNKNKMQEIIAAMHFPPFNTKGQMSMFVDIMRNYKVKKCIYGHLHGDGAKAAKEGIIEDIIFRFVSSDFLGFEPVKIA
jgi:uncharacterized protein